jgi:Tfp pilus assembly protein PilZ
MDRPRGYQRHPRFTKRLEATFNSGGLSYRGILSNLSRNGLFIRTNRGFAPGSTVDIELVMPNNTVCRLKGVVKRTIKTPMSSMKNGMGVELTETDEAYLNFLESFNEDKETAAEAPATETLASEFRIILCPACGVKNKVMNQKLSLGPKCGRCGTSLPVDP